MHRWWKKLAFAAFLAWGAAAGSRDAVLLTLGTGVGGAIMSEGRLVEGHIGRAGHLGHVCLDPDGPVSIAGMPGSLENAIGNGSLSERSKGRFADTRALVEAHVAGDAEAGEIWLRSVWVLACAIASIVNSGCSSILPPIKGGSDVSLQREQSRCCRLASELVARQPARRR